jgi:hypothetical protein
MGQTANPTDPILLNSAALRCWLFSGAGNDRPTARRELSSLYTGLLNKLE